MPILQTMAVRFNKVFGDPANLDRGLFSVEGPGLVESLKELGVVTSGVEYAFIEALPSGIKAALLATLHDNAQRKVPLAITLSWAPAYDYAFKLWEAPGTEVSPGGITIMLESRYPLDQHPSNLTAK